MGENILTDSRKSVILIIRTYDHRSKIKMIKENLDMTYADFFAEVKGKFMDADVSDITEHLAYQFNIEGEAGGIFYVEVKEGKLYVEPYEYYDRDAMFTASAEVLMKIASGKLDPILAVTLQKLKVEGNIEKALKLKEFIASKKK